MSFCTLNYQKLFQFRYILQSMGNCTGMSRPANNTNTTNQQSKVAAPKEETQNLLASKLQNQNNLNVKQNNIQAAARSNLSNKVQELQPAKSQPQKSNVQVGVAKQEPPAPPPKQASEPIVKVSRVEGPPEQPVKVQQEVKNSKAVQKENAPSWIEGSKTPVNQSMRKPEAEQPNNKESVAVSWVNVSRTPGVSKVNEIDGAREVDKNKKQLKDSNILLSKNVPPMKSIQEQAAGESSLSKPNSINNSSKIAGVASNEVKKFDNSIMLNKEEKDDQLQGMISSEAKYGGISISDIKISSLHSNILVNKSNLPNQQGVNATNLSKVEWKNAEFVSPKQGEAVNNSKLEVMNSVVVNYVQNSKLNHQEREDKVNKGDESFSIYEPGRLAQLQDMIPDQCNDSPLKCILWTSRLNIK